MSLLYSLLSSVVYGIIWCCGGSSLARFGMVSGVYVCSCWMFIVCSCCMVCSNVLVFVSCIIYLYGFDGVIVWFCYGCGLVCVVWILRVLVFSVIGLVVVGRIVWLIWLGRLDFILWDRICFRMRVVCCGIGCWGLVVGVWIICWLVLGFWLLLVWCGCVVCVVIIRFGLILCCSWWLVRIFRCRCWIGGFLFWWFWSDLCCRMWWIVWWCSCSLLLVLWWVLVGLGCLGGVWWCMFLGGINGVVGCLVLVLLWSWRIVFWWWRMVEIGWSVSLVVGFWKNLVLLCCVLRILVVLISLLVLGLVVCSVFNVWCFCVSWVWISCMLFVFSMGGCGCVVLLD